MQANMKIVALPKTWTAIKFEFPGPSNRGLRDAIFDGCRRNGGASCSTVALTACGKASLEEVNRVAAEEYRELGFDKVVVGDGDPSIYGRGEVVAYLDQPISSLYGDEQNKAMELARNGAADMGAELP